MLVTAESRQIEVPAAVGFGKQVKNVPCDVAENHQNNDHDE